MDGHKRYRQRLIRASRDFTRRLAVKGEPEPIVDWVENNVMVSSRQMSNFPGLYSTGRTAYVRDVLATLDDRATRRVALCFGAQTGKTQLFIAWLMRILALDPGPVMLAHPSQEEADLFGDTRIKPTLEDSPSLSHLVPSDQRKNYRTGNYRLAGSIVYLIGAGSPSKMASKPVRYAIIDECDKFPAEFTREGDPVDLIDQRTKTFGDRRKVAISSTPTVPDGTIWKELHNGDVRKYWVPCRHCGEFSILQWVNVKFDDTLDTPAEIAASAFYECPCCKGRMDTRDKDAAVLRGEWRATQKPKLRGCVSYHLQSIAAPWVTLESLVQKFIVARREGKSKLRAFINSELADPWYDSDEHIVTSALYGREADYAEGGSFPGPDDRALRARFGGVDVQKSELVCVIREYAPGGASGLVWKGRLKTFDELDEVMTRHGVDSYAVDERYRRRDIYAAALKFTGLIPAYGRKRNAKGTLHEQDWQPINEGKEGGFKVTRVFRLGYDQSAMFEFVADGIKADVTAPPWHLYRGASADPQYCAEVCAKEKVLGVWQAAGNVDDHYGDAEKLTVLLASVKGYLIHVPETDVSETDKTLEVPDVQEEAQV